jgi:hypothetical protein
MQASRQVLAIAGAMLLALAGCASRDAAPSLMNVRNTSQGPDEFSILPPKPLSMPTDLAALPEPTPGGGNLTDPTPNADAVAALGGTPRELGGGVPAGDSALFAHATRFGLSADIRDVLAAEDLDYRRRNNGRLLERLLNVNVYFQAYAPMSLDQQAELLRWRKAGARTPAAPPPQSGTNG